VVGGTDRKWGVIGPQESEQHEGFTHSDEEEAEEEGGAHDPKGGRDPT